MTTGTHIKISHLAVHQLPKLGKGIFR